MGTAMREVFGRVLQTMAEDPRLVVLDADLGSATGMYVPSGSWMSALQSRT